MNTNIVERESIGQQTRKNCQPDHILGISPAVRDLKKEIKRISSCDVTVLITGESGTGKELAARAIHDLSSRAERPFIPVNCGAIPENLVENELFGHNKGAFTDASIHQEGVVKEAESGTLFLDEIGSINPYIQVKLMRLLQDKEYKPLGNPRTRRADIRIIAATNKSLRALVKEGAFREDLYFRLNIVSLAIPPLRERKEDIPLLVGHFIRKYSQEYNKPVKRISPEAMDAFNAYSWPGNIRELENKVQQLLVMVPTPEISRRHLQLPAAAGRSHLYSNRSMIECFKTAKRKAVESFEKDYLTRLLTECNGDPVIAARAAGKSRTAFWNLLAKHGISPREFMSA
jgi:two-component system response regulator GlrR